MFLFKVQLLKLLWLAKYSTESRKEFLHPESLSWRGIQPGIVNLEIEALLVIALERQQNNKLKNN